MPKTAKPFLRTSKKAFYVRHAGRMLSLGPDKAEAERRWHELKAGAPAPLPTTCKTVAQLAVAFDSHAEVHYRKRDNITGEWATTSEYTLVGDVLKRFCNLFGDVRLDSLSPRHLKQFQRQLVSDGLARTTINAYVDRVRRVVKWAVAEEYVGVKRPYRRDSLRNSIIRACEIAYSMPDELRDIKTDDPAERKRLLKLAREWRRENAWHPNQLRHNYGTEARRAGGIEAARVVLGHASVNVTERYAEKDWDAARAVAAKIG